MRAILGIGNPGAEYVDTKHNAGFIILDKLADKFDLSYSPSKYDYYYAEGRLNDSDFCLIKPTTYVNLSGLAAKDFFNNHPLAVEDFLVVVDDIHLELGSVRIRKQGGSGGHNGLESIIYHLETESFPRIRFGIGGKFEDGNQAGYVLSKFNDDEFKFIEGNLNLSVDLIEKFISGGTQSMLDFFSKVSQKENLTTPPTNKE